MTTHDTDDLYRLYTREWVIVHTVTQQAPDASSVVTAAIAWAKENLYGRVRTTDIRCTANTDNAGLFWVHVEVFKDNAKGEFTTAATAETFAKIHELDEYTIVPRNSEADHLLRNYGVTKL